MNPLCFQAFFCLQKTAVNEVTVRLENSDATILEPQDELFEVFFSTWKRRYHEIYRKTKPKHRLEQQTTDLNKPFPLGAAANSFLLY